MNKHLESWQNINKKYNGLILKINYKIMTTLTLKFENNLIDYISEKQLDVNLYLEKLIKEDMLLNKINDSKKSGVNKLNSLSDLDN